MNQKTKKYYLLFFFILSIIFMESLLKIFTSPNLIPLRFLYSSLFAVPIGGILYVICSSFNEKASKILSIVFCSVLTILYISQFIYFKFFRTFYTLYSASNGGQVLEFLGSILSMLAKNILVILLFISPLVTLILMRKRIFIHKRNSLKLRLSVLLLFMCIQLFSVLSLEMLGDHTNSPYDLYFKSNCPAASFDNLGLLTSMRLDFERTLTGWEPIIDTPDIFLADDTPEPKDTKFIDRLLKRKNPAENAIEIIKVPQYNEMNIDFQALISEESDEAMASMHQYFDSITPTEKNEYTGMFKDYNLIFITAESFSPYVVSPELTPTLYKMVNKGFNFKNFYTPIWGVSTSDGEYVACTGLIPKSGVWSMYKSASNSLPFVMGNQFRKLGYKTFAYHNHSYNFYRRDLSHPNLGYDYKGRKHGLVLKDTWPESDLEMMEKTLPEYLNLDKFHAYYMTVSGHMGYSFKGNSMSNKNEAAVAHLPYCEQGRAYIAANIELEKALTYLMDELKKSGKDKNTLIVLSADHYPYGLKDKTLKELVGHLPDRNFEIYKSNLIVYAEGMEPVQVDKYCSSLDIIPTISNLLGLEFDSRLLMGRDIFSPSDPLIIFKNKSFINKDGMFNSTTQEFTPFNDFDPPEGYLDAYCTMVKNKFYYSTKMLETDYYSRIIPPVSQ